MKCDFNEFLRIMTWILIVLLVVQGLDYIFGFGVNNYLFVIFCIVFAFTVGSIYHNILLEKRLNSNTNEYEDKVQDKLTNLQDSITEAYENEGLTDEVFEKQVELNTMRHELDLKDEDEVINEEGFVQ